MDPREPMPRPKEELEVKYVGWSDAARFMVSTQNAVLQTADNLRPRSRPVSWRRRQPTKGWRLPSVDARSRKPKGSLTVWGHARRLLWSWWPWAVISIWALTEANWGWAIGAGVMGLLTYLTAPAALPPRYGLSHEFGIESEEFLNTVAGASSTPFVSGNIVEPLNNGDAFYPRDARRRSPAPASRSRSRRTSTGRAKSDCSSPVRSPSEPVRRRPSRSCSMRLVPRASALTSFAYLEDGGCQVAWYNPIHWYTIGRFNNRTHRKSLIIDGRLAFTGGAGIADHWRGNARGPDEWRDMQIRHRRPGRRSAADGIRAQLATDDRRAA